MRKISLKGFRYAAHWILLIGVLPGIFFSSGEGIQLMPFPASQNTNEKKSSFLEDEREKYYAFSVHNYTNSLSIKSKVQKNVKDFDESKPDANEFRVEKLSVSPSQQYCGEIAYFYDFRFLTSSSNRAPPMLLTV